MNEILTILYIEVLQYKYSVKYLSEIEMLAKPDRDPLDDVIELCRNYIT